MANSNNKSELGRSPLIGQVARMTSTIKQFWSIYFVRSVRVSRQFFVIELWIATVISALQFGNAFAAGLTDPKMAIPGAEQLLNRNGLGGTKTNRIIDGYQANTPTVRKLAAGSQDLPETKAAGLIVRFRSQDVKLLSRQNRPPPQTLIDELGKLVGTPLLFHRGMSMDNFVFRFKVPVSWDEGQAIVEEIRKAPTVESVELDALVEIKLTPNDTYAEYQWNLKNAAVYAGSANLGAAWDITQGSSETVVAVIDTGVRPHADFYTRLLPGYDFVSNVFTANDSDARDADALDPGDWVVANECSNGSTAKDSSWHGTHVAGIIAATGNNFLGIVGINWFSKILPVRVLGKCGGVVSDIVDGMLWAAGLNVPGVPVNPNPAKILNMSLGGTLPGGCSKSIYQEAINSIKARGVLIVVAAGNENLEAASFVPASCDGVMTVGAVGQDGDRASYSNYSLQYKVDISAPGGNASRFGSAGQILSTVNSGKTGPTTSDYMYKQGTSMAAPHVAGIASLALALDPQIAPELLFLALTYTSRTFPSSSLCNTLSPLCGSGLVDAYLTLQAVKALKPYMLVYEFLNVNLNHYFRTGFPAENSAVLTGAAGAGWIDTKNYFLAWRDSSLGAVPVCRFYAPGANSHFYTADAAECALVKKDNGWKYEGIAFYAKLPIGGSCPSGTIPIYRAYNNRFAFNDSNHRFSVDKSEINILVTKGWTFEGTAMCAIGG